jgi:hypothetical protein
MTLRPVVVAAAGALLALPLFAGSAAAAAEVVPQPGVLLSGAVKFPRQQEMTIATDPRDSTRLTVRMGFDGKCKGGGLGEAWGSRIATKPTVRVRGGRFSRTVKGTMRDFGGVKGRTAAFTWRLNGRFESATQVSATVTGSARIRQAGRIVSRCRIARPATVRLTLRS